jgi:TolB-like protein/Tfp pilus assembly protein PilF
VVVQAGEVSGDGVNIASRICSLSEGGGLCVSGEVYQAVRNQPDIEAVSLGEHELKNVGRRVAVYAVGRPGAVSAQRSPVPRVRSRRARWMALAAGVVVVLGVAAWRLWEPEAIRGPSPGAVPEALPGDEAFTVPGFGDRPAIAVLPFDNLSGDPEQEYFSDGISEDLITRLSAWHFSPVIARNSSFVYKGQAVDVKRVSRELGARYVVEGSARKAGDRVRVSAQLIDATTGHHIWARTYDRELSDLFALQDEISQAIVASIQPELLKSEMERAARREPGSLEAYDLVMRGYWHLTKFTREDNARARSLFERAAELDPQSAPPFHGIANTHRIDLSYQWSDSPARSGAEGERAARGCVELDDRNATCYLARGSYYAWSGPLEKAIADFELAIRLNPSSSLGYMWLGNTLATHIPDEAIATLEKGMRLSPQDPFMWVHMSSMGFAHFAAGRYRGAVDWAQRSLQLRSEEGLANSVLVAGYAQLGLMDEARAALSDWLQLQPGSSVAAFERSFYRTTNPEVLVRLVDGLRKAGFPEE